MDLSRSNLIVNERSIDVSRRPDARTVISYTTVGYSLLFAYLSLAGVTAALAVDAEDDPPLETIPTSSIQLRQESIDPGVTAWGQVTLFVLIIYATIDCVFKTRQAYQSIVNGASETIFKVEDHEMIQRLETMVKENQGHMDTVRGQIENIHQWMNVRDDQGLFVWYSHNQRDSLLPPRQFRHAQGVYSPSLRRPATPPPTIITFGDLPSQSHYYRPPEP
jgi:hypothetical protein